MISGDLVESQQMDVVKKFMMRLAKRGWATADKLTVVPGNHDLYPASLIWPMTLNAAYQEFCRLTRRCCAGKDCEAFFSSHQIPFGKRLSSNVALAGLDTVRSGVILDVRYWASGELQEEDIDAAREFFDGKSKVQHKILVTHHYPYEVEFDHVEGNYVEPDPEVARNWLRYTGATLVLCGHMHGTDSRTMGKKCRLVCSGDAGDEGVYHIVDLHANGSVKVKQR